MPHRTPKVAQKRMMLEYEDKRRQRKKKKTKEEKRKETPQIATPRLPSAPHAIQNKIRKGRDYLCGYALANALDLVSSPDRDGA